MKPPHRLFNRLTSGDETAVMVRCDGSRMIVELGAERLLGTSKALCPVCDQFVRTGIPKGGSGEVDVYWRHERPRKA